MAGVTDAARLRAALADCCADASLDPSAFVVFVVERPRPPGTTPLAYLQPGGRVRPDTVAVFRAVGARRVEDFRLRAHRLALWSELLGTREAALAPMLRHEIEHARQFERLGPAFVAADDRLRAAVRALGGAGYEQLPSEREANAAASAYASARLAAAELELLRALPDCRALLSGREEPADLLEETLALLREVSRGPAWAGAPVDEASVTRLRAACRAWPARRARLDLNGSRGAAAVERVAAAAAS